MEVLTERLTGGTPPDFGVSPRVMRISRECPRLTYHAQFCWEMCIFLPGRAFRAGGRAGAQGRALTIGTVLAAGATVHSVTLNGAHVAYQLVTTHRGTAVEVMVPHPAADEVLAVQA